MPVIFACEDDDSMFPWEKESQGFTARKESSKWFSIDMLSYFLPPYNTNQGLPAYHHGALVKIWNFLGVNLNLKISFLDRLYRM